MIRRHLSLFAICCLLLACQANTEPSDPRAPAPTATTKPGLLDGLLGSSKAPEIQVLELVIGLQADTNGMVEQGGESFPGHRELHAHAILPKVPSGTVLRAEWRTATGELIARGEQRATQDGDLLARFHLKPEPALTAGGYRLVLLSGEHELAVREFRIE